MKALLVTLVVEGESLEISSPICQAITSAVMAMRDDHDTAILDAIEDIPDEAIGWRGATPGPVWEPVRRAIAAKRGLPSRFEEESSREEGST